MSALRKLRIAEVLRQLPGAPAPTLPQCHIFTAQATRIPADAFRQMIYSAALEKSCKFGRWYVSALPVTLLSVCQSKCHSRDGSGSQARAASVVRLSPQILDETRLKHAAVVSAWLFSTIHDEVYSTNAPPMAQGCRSLSKSPRWPSKRPTVMLTTCFQHKYLRFSYAHHDDSRKPCKLRSPPWYHQRQSRLSTRFSALKLTNVKMHSSMSGK